MCHCEERVERVTRQSVYKLGGTRLELKNFFRSLFSPGMLLAALEVLRNPRANNHAPLGLFQPLDGLCDLKA